jgi:predicted nucleic acid-binding protein
MPDKIFLDTNLWIYLYTSDCQKMQKISKLVEENFEAIVISSQTLNECFNALTRKKITSITKATTVIKSLINNHPIIPIDKYLVESAIQIHLTYHYSYYDSLIIATASENQCTILYSEDMQHKQIICDTLRILNPFKN